MNKRKIFCIVTLVFMMLHTLVFAEISENTGSYDTYQNRELRPWEEKPSFADDNDIYGSQREEKPVKSGAPIKGSPDIFGNTDEPSNRLRIGNTNRYLCGPNVRETGEGSWIEDESGRDLCYPSMPYSGESWITISVIDAEEELYVFQHGMIHGDTGGWEIKNKDLETIEKSPNGWYRDQDERYAYLLPNEIEAGSGKKSFADTQNTIADNAAETEAAAREKDMIYTYTGIVVTLLAVFVVLCGISIYKAVNL